MPSISEPALLNIDPSRQPDFSFHRSGWAFALDALKPLHSRQGLLFDSFIERTFCWREQSERRRGLIPYREPWVGVLHNPPGVPEWHDVSNAPQTLLSRPPFRESLKCCQGIYVLSEYLREWLAERVNVPVETLTHPTEIPELNFSPDAFLEQPVRRIVHVGWWLRRISSIFRLNAPSYRRCMLEIDHAYFSTVLNRDLDRHNVAAEARAMVERISFLKHEEYDLLLSRNIVLCDLYDSSANNTIIECMARATPILVNPLPAVKEYLGDEYPLYFDNLSEAAEKAENIELVLAAHRYLKDLPLSRLSADEFRKSIVESEIYSRIRSGKQITQTQRAPLATSFPDANATETSTVKWHLSGMEPVESHVGYGTLGTNGELGCDDLRVVVGGAQRETVLSAHAPSSIRFLLTEECSQVRSHVGFNDSASQGNRLPVASFFVIADGNVVAAVENITPEDGLVEISADVCNFTQLELVTTCNVWEFCHTLWVDPVVTQVRVRGRRRTVIDCLKRTDINVPLSSMRPKHRCIATVANDSYVGFLEDMLGSLRTNGQCGDAEVVVFELGDSPRCREVAARFGARCIQTRVLSRVTVGIKALLYSVARVVDADQYICLDADMLILQSLLPVFETLSAIPSDRILVCRESNDKRYRDLQHVLHAAYGGRRSDFERLLGECNGELSYPLVVNDGLFAGCREALLNLDDAICNMSGASEWIDEGRRISWRNQFIFNLALAKLDCAIELDGKFNLQLHAQDVEFQDIGARLVAMWRSMPVSVVHFSAEGKLKYAEWQGRFSGQNHPLPTSRQRDQYSVFVRTIQIWAARFGLRSLAWSFYGTTDAQGARIDEPETMPLFACLFYLIRSNGCRHVLETGTARGVSAACLASAVCDRRHGKVVTMDPYRHEERDTLWSSFPESTRRCIEERRVDSLAGMRAALREGETYDAVLLDSLHDADHVLAEFDLARQLVCPGGLILIHDAWYVNGTVSQAISHIETQGFNVVRLWTAESRIPTDDRLGLALIENRARS